MKKYIKVNDNPAKVTHLRIELYYNLGGFNCFTYKEEPRGYYISVTPVERANMSGYSTETVTAFSGIKQCVKQVTRKSAKAEAEAEKLAVDVMDNLVDYVCKKNGLNLQNLEANLCTN